MIKKKTNAQLKKQLDIIFSIYIRTKFSRGGTVACFTCNKQLAIKEAQCGHFIRRQYLATRYSEDNCRPQCVGCNIFGDGKTVEFARKLEEEKPGIVKKLYRQAQEIVRYYPYEEKIAYYKDLLTKM